MKLFLQKMQNFEHWGLRPQTPIGLRRLDAPPPPNTAPNCEFLTTRLRNTVVRFRTKSVLI